MLPTLPSHSPFPTPQLLCSQDFDSNPFRFIDLARTLAARLNRFIDLREFALFFQEEFHAQTSTSASQRSSLHPHQSQRTALRFPRLAPRVLLLFPYAGHQRRATTRRQATRLHRHAGRPRIHPAFHHAGRRRPGKRHARPDPRPAHPASPAPGRQERTTHPFQHALRSRKADHGARSPQLRPPISDRTPRIRPTARRDAKRPRRRRSRSEPVWPGHPRPRGGNKIRDPDRSPSQATSHKEKRSRRVSARTSREAAKERSPRRKPWDKSRNKSSSAGAKETQHLRTRAPERIPTNQTSASRDTRRDGRQLERPENRLRIRRHLPTKQGGHVEKQSAEMLRLQLTARFSRY